jgi:hypothetical protein
MKAKKIVRACGACPNRLLIFLLVSTPLPPYDKQGGFEEDAASGGEEPAMFELDPKNWTGS